MREGVFVIVMSWREEAKRGSSKVVNGSCRAGRFRPRKKERGVRRALRGAQGSRRVTASSSSSSFHFQAASILISSRPSLRPPPCQKRHLTLTRSAPPCRRIVKRRESPNDACQATRRLSTVSLEPSQTQPLDLSLMTQLRWQMPRSGPATSPARER